MNLNHLHQLNEPNALYATDGRLRIDNNLYENAVRPFVMGRKSCLLTRWLEPMPAQTCTV